MICGLHHNVIGIKQIPPEGLDLRHDRVCQARVLWRELAKGG